MSMFSLTQSDFYSLAEMGDIGQRIGFIRRLLHKQHGTQFSTRSVAERIQIISFTALSAIERGDTKEPSARLLKAISSDFEVDMNVFFDDFYQSGYRPITIGHDATTITSPESSNYFLKIYVIKQNMQGSHKLLYLDNTVQPVDDNQTERLLTVILTELNLQSANIRDKSPRNEAQEIISKNKESNFPWISSSEWEKSITSWIDSKE